MHARLYIWVLALTPFLIIGGCGLPEGDQTTPAGAHYQWLAVRASGDTDAMWALLDPAARHEFDRWLLVEKLVLNEIKTAYPRDDVAAALKAIDGGTRGEMADGKALFASFLVETKPEAVGGLGALGARVSDEVVNSEALTATVKTYGGTDVQLVGDAEGRWYVVLSEAQMGNLQSARRQAERNLARVRSNLKKLGSHGR